MKNKLIFSVLFIIFLFGCGNNNIKFVEDEEHNNMTNATYRFVGESKHLYFETGKVYYDGNKRALLISNFKMKEQNKDVTVSINLSFNNKELYGNLDEKQNEGELIPLQLEQLVISENGMLGEKDNNGNIIGESDAFLETTKETFKDSIKLEAKYCIKNKCNKEKFKIFYIN